MLSKQQLKDVRKIFDTFDVDLSGTIDCSELRFMFRGKAPCHMHNTNTKRCGPTTYEYNGTDK